MLVAASGLRRAVGRPGAPARRQLLHIFNSRTGRFDLNVSVPAEVEAELDAVAAEQAMPNLAAKATPLFVAAQIHDAHLMGKAAAIADKLVEASSAEEDPLVLPNATAAAMTTLYASLNKTGPAMALYTKMKEGGAAVDELVYETLIRTYCEEGKLEEAMKVFDDMKAAGEHPNEYTYTTIALAADKAGDVDGAKACAKEMFARGMKFHVVTEQEAQFADFRARHGDFLAAEAEASL